MASIRKKLSALEDAGAAYTPYAVELRAALAGTPSTLAQWILARGRAAGWCPGLDIYRLVREVEDLAAWWGARHVYNRLQAIPRSTWKYPEDVLAALRPPCGWRGSFRAKSRPEGSAIPENSHELYEN